MRNQQYSFLNELFDTKIVHFQKDYGVFTIEEEDIVKYYRSRCRRSDGFFDQDKVLCFVDENTGCITRESFEKGIQREIQNIIEEQAEAQTKRQQAARLIEELRRKYASRTPENQQLKLLIKVQKLETISVQSEEKALAVQILAQTPSEEIQHSTEYSIINSQSMFFLDNVFNIKHFLKSNIPFQSFPWLTKLEKSAVSMIPLDMNISTTISLRDFLDQRIHKRTYHLQSKRRSELQSFNVTFKIMLIHDIGQLNGQKLALREIAYELINKQLSQRDAALSVRYHALMYYRSLEHLNLICFEKNETLISQSDIRVYKDCESETNSIYNEANQAQLILDDEDEEEREFRKAITLDQDFLNHDKNLSGGKSEDSCDFSFEKTYEVKEEEEPKDQTDTRYFSHQQMLLQHLLPNEADQKNNEKNISSTNNNNNYISRSKLIQPTPISTSNNNQNSTVGGEKQSQKGQNDSLNSGHSGPQFMSPRFNEILTIASSLAAEVERNEKSGLQELQQLYKKTANLMNEYDSRKSIKSIPNSTGMTNQEQQIYLDMAKMSKQELLRFRILIKGINNFAKLQNGTQA